MFRPEQLEQLITTRNARRSITLGVPAPRAHVERRIALTPEGAAILADQGIRVLVERGAGAAISYDDERYARAGAELVSRTETFAADIVLYLSPVTETEATAMQRGAVLLGLFDPAVQSAESVRRLLQRRITVVSIVDIRDHRGNPSIAHILDRINGHAAVTVAAAMLADPENGKGILLGGVPGVNPCEVVVLGSSMAALAAARATIGQGGIVRIFDNDSYGLRTAADTLGPAAVTSALHPKVLGRALASADIVVATPMDRPFCIDQAVTDTMKNGVMIFDLSARAGISAVFPTLKCVDLAMRAGATPPEPAARTRTCYINAAGAVPRTTAMAITNELPGLVQRILGHGTAAGLQTALKTDRGLCAGVMLYDGHVVNPAVGARMAIKTVDITFLLSFS